MTSRRWWRWQDWSLGTKSAAAVAVPVVLLLLALGFSFRLQQALRSADADVRRALAIQADIQSLHSLIAESATGIRGYLLTGRDAFLTPYRQARQQLPLVLTSLRGNIRDPEMKAHLARIQDLLQRKLDSLETLGAQGRALPPSDLQNHLLSSKAVLDELREEIRAMSAREADLVAEYSAEAARALQRNFWVDGVSSVLALATGVGAFLLLFAGVVRRVQRLTVNAERLARGEPLQALPAGRDEVGLLADRLQNASLLLARHASEARAANEAKSRFLSRTSHELRTPLNAILGFAQLLETDLRSPAQIEQTRQILKAGRHLLNLVDEVLDIARIESGEMKLALEPMRLMPLAMEAHALIAPLAESRRISVQISGDLEDLAVQADRQRLLQVLLNLLSNAVKYNRPGGSVTLGASREGERVTIRVEDSGVGIAPEHLHRLFTPFDRLDAGIEAVEGTGLGLALSRQLILCMQGSIEVRSTPGSGSCFSLHLRAADAGTTRDGPASGAAPAPIAVSPQNQRRVLIVEDESSNLALIQAVVARRPAWQTAVAKDGATGLRRALELRPDLVLLDLQLPDGGGESVLSALRADPVSAGMAVVVVSADAQPATVDRLRAAGANGYLTKPISVPKLLALLDQHAQA